MGSFFYNIKQAFQQIWRNRGMALASIFAITAMMLILGIFFIIVVNINLFSEMIKNDYEKIEVYLYDDVTESEANVMMQTIETFGGVKATTYRTKAEALELLKSRWGNNAYLLDSLGDNPLPNSIVVSVDTLESSQKVFERLQDLEGVEDISFFQETVDKLMKVSNFLQVGTLILMAFLIVVSVVVVANTIKLTVLARAREISIMKYIGATNWFIRGPFLVEGIVIGVLSSLVAVGISYLIYDEVIKLAGRQVLTILGTPPVPSEYLAINLIIIFVAMGVSIGACGSIVSMRRYLDT